MSRRKGNHADLKRGACPLSALIFILAAVSLQGQELIFFDDFSDPTAVVDSEMGPIQVPNEEIWGEGSVQNSGSIWSQSVLVKNENAEQFFGEAGQNYLEISALGLDPEPLRLVAEDRFSEASEVITIRLVFHHTGSGEFGPRLRPGIENPTFNATRALQDLRFDNGDFSTLPDVYSLDQAHTMEIVYNNSLADVSYLDGQVVVLSNSYDVWVDGELIVRDHRYNSYTGETSCPVGTGLKSLAFVVFGSDRNHLLVDEIAVYNGPAIQEPFVLPEPETDVVFSDDFNEGSFEKWREPQQTDGLNRIIEIVSEGSEDYFGEPGDPYARFFHSGIESGNMNILAQNAFSSEVITASFDFYEMPDFGTGNLEIVVGRGTTPTSSRTYRIGFNNGTIEGIEGAYLPGQKNNVQIILNNSADAVAYLDGAASVASDSYDLWINGVQVADNHAPAARRGSLAVGLEYSSLMLVVWTTNSQEFLIDNLEVYRVPYVNAPVAEGLTFVEWAVAHGIPENQRGFLDTPAGDGVPNMVKFALGLAPLESDLNGLPRPGILSIDGEDRLALSLTRATNAIGVDWEVEISDDLITWVPEDDPAVEVLESITDEIDRIRIVTSANVDDDRYFARLRVTAVE